MLVVKQKESFYLTELRDKAPNANFPTDKVETFSIQLKQSLDCSWLSKKAYIGQFNKLFTVVNYSCNTIH
jgi:hypothetical protein